MTNEEIWALAERKAQELHLEWVRTFTPEMKESFQRTYVATGFDWLKTRYIDLFGV